MKARPFSALFVLLFLLLASALAGAEPVTFRQAVELALRHSGTMAIATADQQRAHANYLELRNLYLPQVTLGSGLGWTYGYPMSIEGSAPSIFNVDTRQYVINAANRAFMKAAKLDWQATGLNIQNKREEVILETASAYTELDQLTTALKLMRQQEQSALRMEQITGERVNAGVDAEVTLTKAKLGTARVHMRMAETRGAADLQRLRLAQLTGLAADSIETVTESVPKLPEVSQEDDLTKRAAESSLTVKVAEQNAQAKKTRADGVHKTWYPQVDFAGSYGMFARFNNFEDFFKKFQRHNASIGLAIRFPIMDFAGRAHAEAADAEALRAKKEAEAVKEKVSSETLRLQRIVQQLAAAREVARLEHQVARADSDAVNAKAEAGTASPRDQEEARVAESDKYSQFLDADYQLMKAQMQLMRMTGEIEGWALK
ncbi:MAG: TolC family protein [Candidatus Koribacter versatilis]|uniref:TolC family protein n=1 Tax=Candidatus Korobacter versatilis TaxID=658062 RepID=A0A932A8W8_9BACT|nr:TolC family protein [Candidatus Koribacter versatilis]